MAQTRQFERVFSENVTKGRRSFQCTTPCHLFIVLLLCLKCLGASTAANRAFTPEDSEDEPIDTGGMRPAYDDTVQLISASNTSQPLNNAAGLSAELMGCMQSKTSRSCHDDEILWPFGENLDFRRMKVDIRNYFAYKKIHHFPVETYPLPAGAEFPLREGKDVVGDFMHGLQRAFGSTSSEHQQQRYPNCCAFTAFISFTQNLRGDTSLHIPPDYGSYGVAMSADAKRCDVEEMPDNCLQSGGGFRLNVPGRSDQFEAADLLVTFMPLNNRQKVINEYLRPAEHRREEHALCYSIQSSFMGCVTETEQGLDDLLNLVQQPLNLTDAAACLLLELQQASHPEGTRVESVIILSWKDGQPPLSFLSAPWGQVVELRIIRDGAFVPIKGPYEGSTYQHNNIEVNIVLAYT